MKLIEAYNREAWEAFQISQPYAQFLQSWTWGEFRSAHHFPLRRFALIDEAGKWLVAAQMEYRKKWFGLGYWFVPRGPVFATHLDVASRRTALFALCEELLKRPELRYQTVFWRMEPFVSLTESPGLFPLAFYRADALNPATTMRIDLTRSHEELLRRVHEKTRYNLRLAERYGVTIRIGTQTEDFETFLNLMDETVRRNGFMQHSRAYLTQTYQYLAERGMAKLRCAEYEGRILAANIEIWYANTMTYLYGASSSDHRQLMAPYLLQWEAMKDARTHGMRFYDLWGVNPEWKSSFYYRPSWEGLTRFKRRFGGERVTFVGTWDLPFNIYLYRLAHMKYFFRG